MSIFSRSYQSRGKQQEYPNPIKYTSAMQPVVHELRTKDLLHFGAEFHTKYVLISTLYNKQKHTTKRTKGTLASLLFMSIARLFSRAYNKVKKKR